MVVYNTYIIWYGSLHFQKYSFTLGQSLFSKVKRLLKHLKNLLLKKDTSEGRLIHMHIVVDPVLLASTGLEKWVMLPKCN